MMKGMRSIVLFASRITVYGAVADDEFKDKSRTEQLA